MSSDWPWNALDLTGPAPLREVKRAYARQLKAIDRSDPEAFQQLRQAFETAKSWAKETSPAPKKDARPDLRSLTGGAGVMPKVARDMPAKPLTKEPPAPDIATHPEPEPASNEDPITPQPNPLDAPEPLPEDRALEEALAAPRVSPFEITAFWSKFDTLLASQSVKPFEVNEMRALLREPAALLPDIRHDIEWRLYEALDAYVQDVTRPLPPRLARFYEEEFAWLSDGRGLRRIAGWSDRMRELTHVLHISLPIQKPKEPPFKEKMKRDSWDWLLILGLISMFTISWTDLRTYSLGDYPVMFVATLVMLWCGGLLVTLVTSLIIFILRRLRLAGPLYDLTERVAPVFANKHLRTERFQNVLGFSLTAAVICIGAIFNL